MELTNFQYSEIAGYRLTSRIGSGGMGDVYKAFDATLNRTAAIKMLHQKEYGERFKNEAYIQAAINHPNIAKLYEYTIAGNTPCIIMEYVEGQSLDTYLLQRGKLTCAEAERILLQIASALAYLHEKEILHRDVKPQNFKIQDDGKIMMLDFGIAKHKYSPKLTLEGFVVGTTEYMAPEQFNQLVEKKSDIWALGVMTYELVTGYMPFEANNPVTLMSKIGKASFTNPKVLVPDISEKITAIIEKTLRVNAAGRVSAKEIIELLHENGRSVHKRKEKINSSFVWPKILLPVMVVAGALLLFFFLKNIFSPDIKQISPNKPATKTEIHAAPALVKRKIKINVPGIENAILIFPNGSEQAAPFEIEGDDGQKVSFTIRADGYKNKEVQFDLGMGPFTYDFILEKIKTQ